MPKANLEMESRERRRPTRSWLLPFAVGVALSLLVCCSGAEAAPGFLWASGLLDPHEAALNTPSAGPGGVSCVASGFCAVVQSDGAVNVTTDPTGGTEAWTPSYISNTDLTGVSCPTSLFCLAVDTDGNVYTTTSPLTGPWVAAHVSAAPLAAVSCASASACVVVGANGLVLFSSDPTAGASSWSIAVLPIGSLIAVSCSSTDSCAAIAANGEVAATNDPGTGAGGWSVAMIDASTLNGIACPSVSLCIATDVAGNVISSENPTGGASAWQSVSVSPTYGCYSGETCGGLVGATCTSATFCEVVTGGAETSSGLLFPPSGSLLTSSAPAGGASGWVSGPAEAGTPLSCPTEQLCVTSEMAATTDLTSTSGTWSGPAGGLGTTQVPPATCASSAMCLFTDAFGNIAVSSDPTAPTPSWTLSRAPDGLAAITAVSCPTAGFCAATDTIGNILTTSDPTADPPTWTVSPVTSPYRVLRNISCPSTSLCIAAGSTTVAVSTDPTDAQPQWTVTQFSTTDEYLNGLSCPTTSRCFATDLNGNVLTTSTPAAGATGWSLQRVYNNGLQSELGGIQCPTTGFCLAEGEFGGTWSSTDPTSPTPQWKLVEYTGLNSYGVTCLAANFCALAGFANVSASYTPAASHWEQQQIVPGLANFLQSIACPTVTRCLAFDQDGNVYIGDGSPPPSPAQFLTALESGLLPTRKQRSAAALKRFDGYRYTATTLTAGQLNVEWTTIKDNRACRVASGAMTFTEAGKSSLHVTLTPGARSLLNDKNLLIRVHAQFTPTGQPPVAHTESFRLS